LSSIIKSIVKDVSVISVSIVSTIIAIIIANSFPRLNDYIITITWTLTMSKIIKTKIERRIIKSLIGIGVLVLDYSKLRRVPLKFQELNVKLCSIFDDINHLF
jgi:hypothetical protein